MKMGMKEIVSPTQQAKKRDNLKRKYFNPFRLLASRYCDLYLTFGLFLYKVILDNNGKFNQKFKTLT